MGIRAVLRAEAQRAGCVHMMAIMTRWRCLDRRGSTASMSLLRDEFYDATLGSLAEGEILDQRTDTVLRSSPGFGVQGQERASGVDDEGDGDRLLTHRS